MKASVIGASIVVVFLLVFGMLYVSYYDNSINLQNSIKAHQKVCEVKFDQTWKTIQQQAQVKDEYASEFKDAYTALMKGRYEGGIGKFMGMITESNPNLDSAIYTNLQNTIKSARAEFANEQTMLVAQKQQYDALRQRFLGSFFLSNKSVHPDIDIQLVTSEKTDSAYKTGQENDISF